MGLMMGEINSVRQKQVYSSKGEIQKQNMFKKQTKLIREGPQKGKPWEGKKEIEPMNSISEDYVQGT